MSDETIISKHGRTYVMVEQVKPTADLLTCTCGNVMRVPFPDRDDWAAGCGVCGRSWGLKTDEAAGAV